MQGKQLGARVDERGLPHRMLDEQGAEYWRVTGDAAGWRTKGPETDEAAGNSTFPKARNNRTTLKYYFMIVHDGGC